MRDPVWLVRRAGNKILERLRPNDPWLSPGAIRYLDGVLRPDWRGFEWGSGRSTRWFGHRIGHLTSIEHDEAWYGTVSARVADMATVDLRLVPLDHPPLETGELHYDPLPVYVAAVEEEADGGLDVVLVDGAYRQPCVAAALPKLRPGGLLVIDNTDWLPIEQWGVPAGWTLAHQSRNVMTQTTVWIAWT